MVQSINPRKEKVVMNDQNPGQGGNVQPNGNQQNGGNGHPAWQEYLADIPDALKPVVQQAFAKWDQNVQQRIQEVHNQYAPLKAYQPLADNNIQLQYVAQALDFANQLESDPKALVERMNTQLNLGYVPADQVQRQQTQQQQTNPYLDDPFNDFGQQQQQQDNPQIQQLMQMMQGMQAKWDEQEQARQADEQAEQFEMYLDQLTADTPFAENNDARMLITAFMSQGDDGPTALNRVKANFVGTLNSTVEQNINNQQQQNNGGQQFQSTDNPDLQATIQQMLGGQPPQQTNPQAQNQAPVVMGNDGNAGSGSQSAPINWGDMKNDDVSALVTQALAMNSQQEQ